MLIGSRRSGKRHKRNIPDSNIERNPISRNLTSRFNSFLRYLIPPLREKYVESISVSTRT